MKIATNSNNGNRTLTFNMHMIDETKFVKFAFDAAGVAE